MSNDHGQGKDIVKITINNVEKETHRGNQTVADIKALGGVPLVDDLVEIVDGSMVPLADGSSTVIKGGEKLISHPKDSASS